VISDLRLSLFSGLSDTSVVWHRITHLQEARPPSMLAAVVIAWDDDESDLNPVSLHPVDEDEDRW